MEDSFIEECRLLYKPEKVKILLVGESAPAAGTFFYTEDSLCGYVQQAFGEAFGDSVMQLSRKEFLDSFRLWGFYLDDLCQVPVNRMGTGDRKAAWKEGIPFLADRIKKYNPDVIIVMLKGIKDHVHQAARAAGLADRYFYAVPFAGMGNQRNFVREFSTILKELAGEDVIHVEVCGSVAGAIN